jgi:IS5 family transposase
MYANAVICTQKLPRVFHIHRREHRDQLSFKDFFLPFGGQLSGENRWIKLADLIPWDELEDDYAAQFCKGFGAPAKPFRMALGALIIKARLGLTDEELVEQIKENPYLQFFIGLEGYQYSAPFDLSMMVYFRKRLPESVVNDCNERIVHYGLKAGLIQSLSQGSLPGLSAWVEVGGIAPFPCLQALLPQPIST